MAAVMTFYRFVRLDAVEALRGALEAEAEALNLRGTILLADEGINATLAGDPARLARFQDLLRARPPFQDLACRFSEAEPDNPVFFRLKVRVKPEIVRLDQPGVDLVQHPDAALEVGERQERVRQARLGEDPAVDGDVLGRALHAAVIDVGQADSDAVAAGIAAQGV